MKKAFTLAEVMIVLAIIGVLTAILLPVARNAAPDENILKFKKAHNTLHTTIRELVNSDEYYLNGDLGVMPDGTIISGATDEEKKYFCKTFANVINTKKVNCSTNGERYADDATYNKYNLDVDVTRADIGCSWQSEANISILKQALDGVCASNEALNIQEEIVTQDNITYYQTSASQTFGIYFLSCWDVVNDKQGKNYSTSTYEIKENCSTLRHFAIGDNGFICAYKPFCFDIDGTKQGEDPFGYAIRVDGKIINGARAEQWLNKSIQEN